MAFEVWHLGVQWTYLSQFFLILFEHACFWPSQLLLKVCSGKRENKAKVLLVRSKTVCPKISVDVPHFLSSKKQLPHHLLLSSQSFTDCCCHPLHHLFPRLRTSTGCLLVWKRFPSLIILSCPSQSRTALIVSILTHMISLFNVGDAFFFILYSFPNNSYHPICFF